MHGHVQGDVGVFDHEIAHGLSFWLGEGLRIGPSFTARGSATFLCKSATDGMRERVELSRPELIRTSPVEIKVPVGICADAAGAGVYTARLTPVAVLQVRNLISNASLPT